VGGLTAGLPRDQVDALTEFGEAFGMVFQIRDDVLDVIATDEELGKPAGNDLVEGVYTLPVIRALAMQGVGPDLSDLLGTPLSPAERDRARDLVRTSGAVEEAVAVAGEWAAKAASALAPMGDTEVARSLSTLPRHLLTDLPAPP
jgi:geranylgeranyl pyrophosphate synthase